MQIKLASRCRSAVESARAHDLSVRNPACLSMSVRVDRHYRPRMPASGAEKTFTVSQISAQLFRVRAGNWYACTGETARIGVEHIRKQRLTATNLVGGGN